MAGPEEVFVWKLLHQLQVLNDALMYVTPDIDRIRALIHRDLMYLITNGEVEYSEIRILRRRNLSRHDVLIILCLTLTGHFLEESGGVYKRKAHQAKARSATQQRERRAHFRYKTMRLLLLFSDCYCNRFDSVRERVYGYTRSSSL